jgi:hypothetical protein
MMCEAWIGIAAILILVGIGLLICYLFPQKGGSDGFPDF